MRHKFGRIVGINLVILVVYFIGIIILKELDGLFQWQDYEAENLLMLLIGLQVLINIGASMMSVFVRRELAAPFLLSAGVSLMIGVSGCFAILSL